MYSRVAAAVAQKPTTTLPRTCSATTIDGITYPKKPEEFQIILKLGVWVRTQIEQQTPLGQQLASGFIAHEKARRKRRKDAPRATERQAEEP